MIRIFLIIAISLCSSSAYASSLIAIQKAFDLKRVTSKVLKDNIDAARLAKYQQQGAKFAYASAKNAGRNAAETVRDVFVFTNKEGTKKVKLFSNKFHAYTMTPSYIRQHVPTQGGTPPYWYGNNKVPNHYLEFRTEGNRQIFQNSKLGDTELVPQEALLRARQESYNMLGYYAGAADESLTKSLDTSRLKTEYERLFDFIQSQVRNAK